MAKKFRWNNEVFDCDNDPHFYDVHEIISLRPLEIRTFGLKKVGKMIYSKE